MKKFKAPRKALSDLDADAVATVVMAAADIALIIDRRGVIKDLAIGQAGLSADLEPDWIGKPFAEVVTSESEPKVRMLLAEDETADLAARQLNHPARGGATIPITYSLRSLGKDGLRLAVGRDLRPLAELQQRLIEAEQSLERDYSRLRLAETRYRLLLQSSTDPILIIDAATQKIVDLNSGAAKLLGATPQRLLGQAFGESLKPASSRTFLDWMTNLRTTGRADVLRVRFASDNGEQRIAGALFRQENVSHVLLRITPATACGRAGRKPDAPRGHHARFARCPHRH